MDATFRALSDPTRRALLDALTDHDGQALMELQAAAVGIGRFGVMKHLQVLEHAGLVITRREGRRKLHYLNPVPIQEIADRWIGRYARPWTETLTGLKAKLEDPTAMTGATHAYEIYIRTTPERLWDAITNPEVTRQYWHAALNRSTWQPGARWTSESDSGELYLDGEILEADPPRRLVHTFHVVHAADAAAEPPSRLTWEITPMGESCRLRLIHEELPPVTADYVRGGWEGIISGLKTLLETGEPLKIGEPAAA